MTELLQFDDFAADIQAVREAVIKRDFSTQQGPDGASYTGISQYQVPQWFKRIAELRGYTIDPKISCFRLNLAGELPHSWVHSDDICAKFASVLYLNTPEQLRGGTAFWRHKELGVDRLESKEELIKRGVDAEAYYEMMTEEWKILDHWQQIGFIAMKFNRFITYPTFLFHSRYPHEGFGSTPEDGRLIWICFYD